MYMFYFIFLVLIIFGYKQVCSYTKSAMYSYLHNLPQFDMRNVCNILLTADTFFSVTFCFTDALCPLWGLDGLELRKFMYVSWKTIDRIFNLCSSLLVYSYYPQSLHMATQ